jgi:hypothetical protein
MVLSLENEFELCDIGTIFSVNFGKQVVLPGVKALIHFPQMNVALMSIPDGCLNGLMSQKLLYVAQVGAVLQQVGRRRMTDRMRALTSILDSRSLQIMHEPLPDCRDR